MKHTDVRDLLIQWVRSLMSTLITSLHGCSHLLHFLHIVGGAADPQRRRARRLLQQDLGFIVTRVVAVVVERQLDVRTRVIDGVHFFGKSGLTTKAPKKIEKSVSIKEKQYQ